MSVSGLTNKEIATAAVRVFQMLPDTEADLEFSIEPDEFWITLIGMLDQAKSERRISYELIALALHPDVVVASLFSEIKTELTL